MAVTTQLHRSLKFRMTAVVVLLVLAATVVVASAALLLAERDMKSVIGDQQYALLSATAAQIDAQLEARRLLLSSLAESMPRDLDFDPDRLRAFAARHHTVRQQFLNVVLYDHDGTLRYSFNSGAIAIQQSAVSRAFFAQTVSLKRSVVSAPFRSGVSGQPVVLISQPVLDANGEVKLVLAGGIDLLHSSFLDQVSMQKPGKTGFLFIMTSKGILVHHPNPARLLEHINSRPGQNLATEKALSGFEGWTEAVNKDGVDGIYAYKRLRNADWIVFTINGQQTARVWDLGTGKAVGTASGHPQEVKLGCDATSLAGSP